MVRANFSTRFLVGSFEGFWGISSAAERKFEGFAGSLKVAGILRSFIAAVDQRKRKIIASQPGGSKAGGDSNRPSKKPQEFQPFSRTQQKNPWTSLVFQFLKIGPSSRVGLAETVQSTYWKKIPNPRNDSSIFHSSPVQEQSNPQNPPKTHRKSNASPKKPSTRSSKNFNQNLPVSPKFLQKKNWILLDDSKADKNIPNCSLTQLANWSVVRRLDSSIF
jgi:hypothetical protein